MKGKKGGRIIKGRKEQEGEEEEEEGVGAAGDEDVTAQRLI